MKLRLTGLFFISMLYISFTTGDYKLLKSIKTPSVDQIAVDNLGSTYTLGGNVLSKYSLALDTPLTYNNKGLGKLGSIDVSNPLKLVLLYADFAQIILLDSRLSETSAINLRDMGILQPTLVCNSYNNCIWVYDQQDFQLKRVDPSLQVTNQSGNITQITGHDIAPVSLTSYNNWIFMVDTVSGILQFDLYGTYYKTIPAKNVSSVQVIDNSLLYLQHNKDGVALYSYNIKSGQTQPILLPLTNKNIKETRIFGQNLFLLQEEHLDLYSY